MEFRVTDRTEVSSTEARSFLAGDREVILCDVDGEIYALDAICTHEDLPLEGGEIDEGRLECPWHGAVYEICTGAVRALPATRPLEVFPVRVDADGAVWVTLPDA